MAEPSETEPEQAAVPDLSNADWAGPPVFAGPPIVQDMPPSGRDEELERLRARLDREISRGIAVDAELARQRQRAEHAEGELSSLRDHRARWQTEHDRAEQAEATIERVRRLCELTIAVSCRVQAIDQARDTLAALAAPELPDGEA